MPQLNLANIAASVLNEPLLMEPAYARVFLCSVAGQLGIPRLTDSLTGVRMTPTDTPGEMVSFEYAGREPASRSYAVQDRIAIVPVSGSLIAKSTVAYSWVTGYDGIIQRLQQAMADPGVDGVLLDMNTPGGFSSGAFDCADMIARLREEKPVWALANDMNCSAGQLLASACSRRLVTQTARTGSIGVMMAHSNYAGALEQYGLEITLLYSGKHKVDGNQWNKLDPDVRSRFQERMDATRLAFAEKVAGYTGMNVQAILDTEALVYEGAEALDVGLADELVINSDAVGVMREAIAKKSQINTGASMAENTQPQVTATAPEATLPAATIAPVPDVHAAVKAENDRIMGILTCAAAEGREAQARVLASTPGMSVEVATSILEAGAQSVQVRTDTGLDALMGAQSPEPVQTGSKAENDDPAFALLMTINPEF